MIYKGISYDKQYIELCKRILNEGTLDQNPRPHYEDGTPAHALTIFNHEMTIDENQVPVLFSKKLFFKKAIEEVLWIWQQRSNKVADLQKLNNKIWNEWEMEDGTIGKAYGYQLNKKVDDTNLNQVDHLIHKLKTDPESRRHIVTMWNVEEGHEMALKPCVYETHWVVVNNKLNLKVMIRSNDCSLGNPFDIIQYWFLHKLIANEVDIEPGKIVFSITIPHIYDRHIETIKAQINRFEKLNKIDPVDQKEVTVKIDDNASFDTVNWNDITVEGYNEFAGEPLKKYQFEIAI